MIKIIKPRDHKHHQAKIEAFLDLFTIYQRQVDPLKEPLKEPLRFEFSSEEQSKITFIIAEDTKRGVYGGALLYQLSVKDIDEKLGKVISALSNKTKVWVSRLCFCAEKEDLDSENLDPGFSSDIEQLDFCHRFYHDLLREFIKFGKKQKAGFLVLSLTPMNYFKTKSYGDWPYLLEIQPKYSPDELFHGLLPLKAEKKGTHNNNLESLKGLRQMRRRR